MQRNKLLIQQQLRPKQVHSLQLEQRRLLKPQQQIQRNKLQVRQQLRRN